MSRKEGNNRAVDEKSIAAIFNLFGSGFFLFSFINVVSCKLRYRG